MRARLRRVVTVLPLFVWAQAFAWQSASAQTPASALAFDEAKARLRPGDRLIVTDTQQQPIEGRLVELSPCSLRMLVDGQRQDLPLDDLLRIDRRTSDSLLNGALIGAALGGVFFLSYYSENALCQSNCQFTSGALATIGIGAATGAGLDALTARNETVFERPPPSQLTRDGSRARSGMRWSISLQIDW
jgi:hypothetical protein